MLKKKINLIITFIFLLYIQNAMCINLKVKVQGCKNHIEKLNSKLNYKIKIFVKINDNLYRINNAIIDYNGKKIRYKKNGVIILNDGNNDIKVKKIILRPIYICSEIVRKNPKITSDIVNFFNEFYKKIPEIDGYYLPKIRRKLKILVNKYIHDSNVWSSDYFFVEKRMRIFINTFSKKNWDNFFIKRISARIFNFVKNKKYNEQRIYKQLLNAETLLKFLKIIKYSENFNFTTRNLSNLIRSFPKMTIYRMENLILNLIFFCKNPVTLVKKIKQLISDFSKTDRKYFRANLASYFRNSLQNLLFIDKIFVLPINYRESDYIIISEKWFAGRKIFVFNSNKLFYVKRKNKDRIIIPKKSLNANDFLLFTYENNKIIYLFSKKFEFRNLENTLSEFFSKWVK